MGANARLGYVFYLQGRYDEAIREYERGLAFVSSSDHALKERTSIEITMKIGATASEWEEPRRPPILRPSSLKNFEARVAKGADDPYTRYYIACLLALRGREGDADKALDALERVYASLPALTAARVRRDPDLESLRGRPRFEAIANG